MDISNIALVRATDVIPFDGIVKPISEVPYLKKNTSSKFAFAMNDLLRKVEKMPPITFEIMEEDIKNRQEILKKYIPYTSDYNSMVLWSINGLVPDDSENGFGNNTFSNKKCVIIDGLKEQLTLSSVVSIVSTDTAIQGNVELSDSAIILIEQNEYNLLNEEQKKQLSKFNVKTFSGELRQSVEETLIETNRYAPERPILNKAEGGFKKSDTSEETKDLINSVAKENNILQMYHFDIIFDKNNNVPGELKNEFENINIVNTYFQEKFYKYLANNMNIDKELAENLENYPDTDFYIKELCEKIEDFGIENYKKLLDKYNTRLEQLRENKTLPTPQQIVDTVRRDKSKEVEDYDKDIMEL